MKLIINKNIYLIASFVLGIGFTAGAMERDFKRVKTDAEINAELCEINEKIRNRRPYPQPPALLTHRESQRILNEQFVKAVRKGDKEKVQSLIKAGADVNAKNKDGMTALMVAAQNGYEEIVRLLIKAGANVNAKDKDGMTALIWLSASDWIHKEDILIEIAQLLIDAGADVNAKDKDGMTVLMAAEWRVEVEEFDKFVRFLIKAGADVNAQDNDGWTALIAEVSMFCSLEVIQCLIQFGADVHAENIYGDTALKLIMQKREELEEDEEDTTDIDSIIALLSNPDAISKLVSERDPAIVRSIMARRAHCTHAASKNNLANTLLNRELGI